ncbi:hypothetical protein SAMN04488581_2666 [Mycolicibacterium neoaurum]|uniref:hypothetical protein n=1 Tax=Mycolicibacterium neoaurum TaxID=1795 RepID=UPI00056BB0F9|nr:hypothetical protein [Mycolicibacterium neoaurum]SDD61387.1 hypothetical protein SAMN04488581_2666 [Mycolicibacterium neoaurum]
MSDLRSVLTAQYQKHGELTPQIVVEEARPDTAPLHNRFEWDDEVAGEKYRLVQAAELIRSVRITFSDNKTGERRYVRGFHSLRQAGDTERGGYAPTEEIVQDEIATKLLLNELKREIADLRKKYGHLEEFITVLREEAGEIAS